MATSPFDTTSRTLLVRLTEAAAASTSLVPLQVLGDGGGAPSTGLVDLDKALTASGDVLIWRICQPLGRRASRGGRSIAAQISATLRERLARTLVIIAKDISVFTKLSANLKRSAEIERVEAAVPRTAAGPTNIPGLPGPQDQHLPKQWSLTAIQWKKLSIQAKNAEAACDVGVIDTRILTFNPDLPASKVIPAKDFVTNEGYTAEDSTHGTAVASILGATMTLGPTKPFDSPTGMVGVHPRARLCSAVVLRNTNPNGDKASSAEMCAALVYLADGPNKALADSPRARVINISIAGSESSSTEREAIYYALARGALVVAASGNRGKDQPDYPARYEAEHGSVSPPWTESTSVQLALWGLSAALLVVGAVCEEETEGAGFPLYDKSNAVGERGIVAPGEEVLAINNEGHCEWMSGTSFAAPHVSGAASLLIAVYNALGKTTPSNTTLARILRSTASPEKLAPPEADGPVEPRWYGKGLLDVKAAVENIS